MIDVEKLQIIQKRTTELEYVVHSERLKKLSLFWLWKIKLMGDFITDYTHNFFFKVIW